MPDCAGSDLRRMPVYKGGVLFFNSESWMGGCEFQWIGSSGGGKYYEEGGGGGVGRAAKEPPVLRCVKMLLCIVCMYLVF